MLMSQWIEIYYLFYACSSGGHLAQACVWSMFLSRHSPRKEEVWATRMEHQGTHTQWTDKSFA